MATPAKVAAPVFAPPAPTMAAAPMEDTVIRAGDTAKGLYDYVGEGDKLSFKAVRTLSLSLSLSITHTHTLSRSCCLGA